VGEVFFMPTFVRNIEISSVQNSSVIHVGDIIKSSPVSSTKTFTGSASFNTGDTFGVDIKNNVGNVSHTNDQDFKDSNAKKTE
jgi:hypothetical protein